MQVKWKDGFGIYKDVDPNRVYSEILAIGESATPEQIVEAAKDESSELHKCFTWDDTKAAENWRKQEARQIVHFLVVRDDDRTNDKPEIRVFHKIENNAGYKAPPVVFKVDDEYQKLLQKAYAELRAFKQKYSSLIELDYILQLID